MERRNSQRGCSGDAATRAERVRRKAILYETDPEKLAEVLMIPQNKAYQLVAGLEPADVSLRNAYYPVLSAPQGKPTTI